MQASFCGILAQAGAGAEMVIYVMSRGEEPWQVKSAPNTLDPAMN